MKYVIDDFRKMTGGQVTATSRDLRHRYIQGFVPHYRDLASESSDASFRSRASHPYSLVSLASRDVLRTITGAYPVIMIANEHNALGKVIYSTDLWRFYVDDSSQTDLGIPNGTPTSNVGIDAVLFNGKILTSHPTKDRLYSGSVDATPGWAATTGDTITTGNVHRLKNLEDRCLVTNASSGAFSRSDEVKIVLPDFSIIDGIVLGDTFDIRDIAAYQDRYALLFCIKTTSPRLLPHTTVFLWNAQPGDSYDQKYTLKGIYKCHTERNGSIFVFTQVGTTLACHVFNGGGFSEVGTIKNIVVSEQTSIAKSRISVEGDFFVLLATCPGNSTNTSPFYWNPYTGESFFLDEGINSQPFRSILIAQDPNSSSYAYERYASHVISSNGTVRKYTLEATAGVVSAPVYKSNLIPAPVVERIHDDVGRMQIKSIEIEYSSKPPTADDSISFTLTTKDEYATETYSTQTATVKHTTAASTNARVDDKRAIIDLGANATEFGVEVSVTPNIIAEPWTTTIRRIIVNYEPIALQS